ncbi:sugar isomerase domain-containing protein [Rhodobacteraceae bacterium RKSG542]|uniref:sugar isomerase domain-containing protein n=1 Tax=Pseudovibrio flavus TaxID=2529854 RepID=UPI0012BC8A6E|nr:SIS domain-containing protein [Pseudovibrio flavus]MTI18109.1 sugar isomerase domain-containing protein [Pseudovibrio flavus]
MSLSRQYLDKITSHLEAIHDDVNENILKAANLLADQIAEDKLIHVAASGGHSNLATQEIFFRAGGLMHINPIMDEGTLLTNGALRSMAIERLPDYGKIVSANNPMNAGDVMVLINAYGINAAVLDLAIEAKKKGVTVIAVTSIQHAEETPKDHPARHPTKQNLADVADITLDCKVQVGDAVMEVEGITQKVAAMSTFANSFILNCLVMETVNILGTRGIEPPIWKSGNATGGDAWNNQFIDRFRGRIRLL